jgi:hypothetical protein
MTSLVLSPEMTEFHDFVIEFRRGNILRLLT